MYVCRLEGIKYMYFFSSEKSSNSETVFFWGGGGGVGALPVPFVY